MDKIDLPVLPSSMTLKAALDLLSLMKRSALVTTNITGARVIIESSQLLAKGALATTPLHERATTPGALLLGKDERHLDQRGEQALDKAQAQYGIGEINDGKATVYTRHEGIARHLEITIGYCCCDGPEQEICAPGDYPNGFCALGHKLDCSGA